VIPVEVSAERDVPRNDIDAAYRRVASLDRFVDDPPTGARLAVRHLARSPGGRRPYVADASLAYRGRVLAAHATGRAPVEAADQVAERLSRQLLRVTKGDVARRNEPDEIERGLADLELVLHDRPEARLKPPEERVIVRRHTYSDHPEGTLSAIADMLDLDEEFHLFVHVLTHEDAVVHRRDDNRIGLLHPPASALADENDVVVTEPGRYSAPIPLATARAEMDILNHRFLYFIEVEDGRGRVLYLRHDGDYGLVEPE
jgi:ribosome-associated translation inhibitor RaiA